MIPLKSAIHHNGRWVLLGVFPGFVGRAGPDARPDTARTGNSVRLQCPAESRTVPTSMPSTCGFSVRLIGPDTSRVLLGEGARGGRREPVSGSPARPIGPDTAGRTLHDADLRGDGRSIAQPPKGLTRVWAR